jgi:urease accessory protein
MGALLLGAARFSVVTCAGIAGLFAIFHGAAHGLEMPLNANGAEYALGFAVATALLHVVGIGFGAVIARFQAPIVTRVTGSVIAIAGLFLALA